MNTRKSPTVKKVEEKDVYYDDIFRLYKDRKRSWKTLTKKEKESLWLCRDQGRHSDALALSTKLQQDIDDCNNQLRYRTFIHDVLSRFDCNESQARQVFLHYGYPNYDDGLDEESVREFISHL